MRQLTERSAKWMAGVKANFESATGKPVEAWIARIQQRRLDRDIKLARKWLREDQGLTTVQTTLVLEALNGSAEPDEDAMLSAQFSGKKTALRPVYDSLERAARALGDDVMIAPRKTQVTFARKVTFAVVRAASASRLDLALRLPGEKGTARLVVDARATGTDPTHVVALAAAKDVDAEVKKWMARAYRAAQR